MADPFQILIAFVLGVFVYAIAIRFLPGKQPGEDKIDQLLERIGVHTETVAANTTATQAAVATVANAGAAASATASPSTAAIAAAAAALQMQNAANAAAAQKPAESAVAIAQTPIATAQAPEETAVQFALRNGLDVARFVQFSVTMPGNLSFQDMLPAFRAWTPPGSIAAPFNNGANLPALNGENLCRMVVAYASGQQDADQTLKANLGGMWALYVNAYETGAGPLGADIAVLRTPEGSAAWALAGSQQATPTSPNAVAAVQRLLDLRAIKGGGSLAGFAGA